MKRPDITTDQLVADYAAGMSLKVIATRYGITNRAVAYRLHQAGVTLRSRGTGRAQCRRRTSTPTTRQQRIMDALRANPRQSYRELQEACDAGSTSTIGYNLRQLAQAGLIKLHAGQRAIEVVGQDTDAREALEKARRALSLTVQHTTGYDWNADPLGLTLIQGEAFAAIDAALG